MRCKIFLQKLFMLPLTLAAFAMTAQIARAEDDAAIHQSLRALLKTVEQTVNAGEYGKLGQYFDEQPLITPINQEPISSREGIERYFDKWFGVSSPLKSVRLNMEADQLTSLSANKDWGIVAGSGAENYALKDGSQFVFKTRWTATVKKEADGQWRILTLHLGTNFLDNPLLDEAKAAAWRFSIGAAILGLIVGVLIGILFKRRKR